ncbi:MAG TPA: ABC transporter C-terminal domain-containing protein, partial [Lachnospiraceae bacterium]|nr:ABC transporter C-terminal domain-containing protein [Lachnospiraceae bacterium]
KETRKNREDNTTGNGLKAGTESGALSEEGKASSTATWKQKSNKPKFTYQEQKEFDTIDETIAGLEAKLEEIEQATVTAATNYSKLNELMKQKEEVEKSLEEKMERWVYLNDLAEQIEAARAEK